MCPLPDQDVSPLGLSLSLWSPWSPHLSQLPQGLGLAAHGAQEQVPAGRGGCLTQPVYPGAVRRARQGTVQPLLGRKPHIKGVQTLLTRRHLRGHHTPTGCAAGESHSCPHPTSAPKPWLRHWTPFYCRSHLVLSFPATEACYKSGPATHHQRDIHSSL